MRATGASLLCLSFLILGASVPAGDDAETRVPRIAPPPREPLAAAIPPAKASVSETAKDSGVRKLVAGEPEAEAVTVFAPEESFSNACQPPIPGQRPSVPKTLADLRGQLGRGFAIARRGSFLIASDLDGKEFDVLVDGVFTCCRSCLENDFFPASVTETVTIYVFRDEKSYNYNIPRLFAIQPISPYGHYGNKQRYIVVNYETGPGTLVHELTHSLMAEDFPDAPIWISEGLASLYEQCRVEKESLRGEPNWRLPELLDALDKGELAPLADLLAYDTCAFRAKRESLHYAQSRYFCKYLEERGALRKVYAAFRNGFDKDRSGIRFVEQAMGRPLAAIETDWHAWIRTQTWK